MQLTVGLGNPGQPYARTRHNIGFAVLEALAEKNSQGNAWTAFSPRSLTCSLRLGPDNHTLLKPQTYMNESGQSVREVMAYFKVPHQEILVVHDDVDLPFLTLRFDYGAGAAGHRGVQNIIDTLEGNGFWRLRFGVGKPPEGIPTEAYVLQQFSADETAALVKEHATMVQILQTTLEQGLTQSKTIRLNNINPALGGERHAP